MEKILKELIEEYKKKGFEIKIIKEDEIRVTINVSSTYKKQKFVENLEILKEFTDKEIIKSNIDYLIHNSLDRFLRGE